MMNNRGSMNNGSVVSRGSMNNWSMVSGGSMYYWSSMNNRCMVSRGSMDHRSSMYYRSSIIASNPLIGDICNVSRLPISTIVDHLSPAIRKSHPVCTRGGVSISLLFLCKVSSTVVITHSILVSIQGRLGQVRGGIAYHWGRGGSVGTGKGGGKD